MKKIKEELQKDLKKVQDTSRKELHSQDYKLQRIIDDKDKVVKAELLDSIELFIFKAKAEVKTDSSKKDADLKQEIY